ncbi:MAG TPA: hypothetical protein VMT64_12570 [Candidatus Binataceae bacterium]|nr:hypothetical protein [Candidatus Binataceae bacterium]
MSKSIPLIGQIVVPPGAFSVNVFGQFFLDSKGSMKVQVSFAPSDAINYATYSKSTATIRHTPLSM